MQCNFNLEIERNECADKLNKVKEKMLKNQAVSSFCTNLFLWDLNAGELVFYCN